METTHYPLSSSVALFLFTYLFALFTSRRIKVSRLLYQKILSILTTRQRYRLYALIATLTVISWVEMLGAFAIIPFIQLASSSSITSAKPIIKKIYSWGDFQNFEQFLFFVGVASLLSIFLSSVLKILSQWLRQKYTWDVSHELGTRLLQVYLKKPYEYYLNTNSSKIVSNLVVESTRVTTNALFPIVNIVVALVSIAVVMIILFVYNPMVTLSITVFSSLILGLIFLFVRPILSRLSKERLDLNFGRFKSLKESIAGIKTFKINNSLHFFYTRYHDISYQLSKIQPKVSLISVIPKNLLDVLLFGTIILFVIVGVTYRLDFQSYLTLLSVYAVAAYKLLPLLNSLFGNSVSIKHASESVEALYQDLFDGEDITFEKGTEEKLPFTDQISIRNVSYKYEGADQYTLSELSMGIAKGHTIALLGQTGSGKTTLIDILVGLLKPADGFIAIDQQQIKESNLLQWQNIFSYVTQDVYLFDDTLKTNMLLELDVSDQYLKQVLDVVQLTEFVEQQPEGLNIMVGERGVKLSGGQKQRIGLARALLRNPSVLILDEATNAIDVKTEEMFFRALKTAFPMLTIIVITHRLSIIENMDCIYYLKDGNIDSKGTYQQLLNDSEEFNQLIAYS